MTHTTVIENEKTLAYPAAPTGLKVTPSDNGILVDWDDSPEEDLASYALYRMPENDKFMLENMRATGLDESHFEDKFVKGGTKYTYWVTALDMGTRQSAASSKIEVTLPEGWEPKIKHISYEELRKKKN